MSTVVRKGYVNLPHGQVHYRVAGEGPAVVLLHDSPRSSAMHVQLLRDLGQHFTAIALDTPGYGNSAPLPEQPRPEMADFAKALAATLQALGIERCPVYGFHTSSKINLQFSIDHPERVTLAIMDGLNLPPGGPDEAFITRYMKPFVLSDDGSHFAASWAKARDFFRFFPWFNHETAARLPLDFPDDQFLHRYALDMLMAGRHYSSAYGAAMRYWALPQVGKVRAPSVFMCRDNDPLFIFLDALPRDLPAHCSVQRLTADTAAWQKNLTSLFSANVVGTAPRLPDPFDDSAASPRRSYVNLSHGQVSVQRFGQSGGTPLLLLPEAPGSAAALSDLAAELSRDRLVYVIELPGIGESEPLPAPSVLSHANMLVEFCGALSLPPIDVYAQFTSAPFALELARVAPQCVHSLALAGLPLLSERQRTEAPRRYCPALQVSWDGAHFASLWHRLRDQELCWPWYERGVAGIRRRLPQIDGERLHEQTLALAKQLDHYGDAALAALVHDNAAALRGCTVPVAMLCSRDDVRDAAVLQLTRTELGAATLLSRPARIDELADVLRTWIAAAV